MPAGLIGPTFVMGPALAQCLVLLCHGSFPTPVLILFYALLGMAAMAATLQAPLAALIAVLELTSNTDIILPALFIVAVL